MGLLDHFAEDEQPASDWSLAEEAAQFAPPLWEPAHVEPEGITALPYDFPVADPFTTNPRIERFKALMVEHAHCKTRNCTLDDREVLAERVAAEAAEAIGDLRRCAVVLWAHGETLLAEVIAEQVDHLTHNVLRPFFESAGLDVEDEAEDEG